MEALYACGVEDPGGVERRGLSGPADAPGARGVRDEKQNVAS